MGLLDTVTSGEIQVRLSDLGACSGRSYRKIEVLNSGVHQMRPFLFQVSSREDSHSAHKGSCHGNELVSTSRRN